MKIKELLARDTLSLSFEVFPPKTESGFDSVKTATEEIAALKPAFMSVTYGAGGGTSRYTLDIAKNIKAQYGVPTLAHLTCVSSTRETVAEKIAAIRAECDRRGLNVDIQVDGGINMTTAPIAAKAGANILVAGSAIFNAEDMPKAVAQMREIAE